MPKEVLSRLSGGMREDIVDAMDFNALSWATEVEYDREGRLRTRRGYRTFGDDLGANPITSYFFYQRRDNNERVAVCHSGSNVYAYNEGTNSWSSLYANNHQYETIPGWTTYHTRRDHVVHNNICYMCNGVSVYQKYDGTTHALIGSGGSGTCTADHTTDTFTKVAHGYTANYEIYITSSGSMPTGITAYQVYYIIVASVDTFQLASSPNGDAVAFSSNGTGTLSTFDLTERRMRYHLFTNDRLISSGNNQTPASVYYTNASPTDLTSPNQNVTIVGDNEIGAVLGLYDWDGGILVMGEKKIYYMVPAGAVSRVDSVRGGFSHRSLVTVEDGVVYQTDKGIEALKRRDGVTGGNQISANELSKAVYKTIALVSKDRKRFTDCFYNSRLQKLFVTLDTQRVVDMDTVLVYHPMNNAWTYFASYPAVFNWGTYIDDDGYEKQIMACGDGRCYEYDYGWDDNGTDITAGFGTNTFALSNEYKVKMVQYIEVSGWVESGASFTFSYNLNLYDGSVSYTDDITISETNGYSMVINPSENYDDSGTTKTLYRFVKRIPIFRYASNVQYYVASTDCQWIIENVRLVYEDTNLDLFPYNNIT